MQSSHHPIYRARLYRSTSVVGTIDQPVSECGWRHHATGAAAERLTSKVSSHPGSQCECGMICATYKSSVDEPGHASTEYTALIANNTNATTCIFLFLVTATPANTKNRKRHCNTLTSLQSLQDTAMNKFCEFHVIESIEETKTRSID